MDRVERVKLKQLANDAIIATYGQNSRESQLAESMEKILEWLDRLDEMPHCETCQCHGVRE